MAPEVLFCEKYNEKADIWSIGVIIFELVVGKEKYPFNAKDKSELIWNVKNCEPDFSFPEVSNIS
jgi:serine/threonine-protein kinase ULK2